MIKVDRKEPAPAILEGEARTAAYSAAAAHFASEDSAARQNKYRFTDLYKHDTVRDGLASVFKDKCAFCESKLSLAVAMSIVHHFRPKQEAVDDDGKVSRPHYWWLAYEWNNLYLTCQQCAVAAGSRFPVDRRRAPVEAVGERLLAEEPVLLDPCYDDPDEHLCFKGDGTVHGLTRRGTFTIATYALNRVPLVRERKLAIKAALGRPPAPVAGATEYAGALRQLLGEPPASVTRGLSGVHAAISNWADDARRRSAGVADEGLLIVERLWIRNFRGIEDLKLTLAPRDDDAASTVPIGEDERVRAPWMVLIGENGHGKTSILQALALVLMGARARSGLGIAPYELVHKNAVEAEITVEFRGRPPRSLRIRRGAGFEASGDDTPWVMAGYGAARIPFPPRFEWLQPTSVRLPRVQSLFRPGRQLVPADRWLRRSKDFEYVARALKGILLQPETTEVVRKGDSIQLHPQDEPAIDVRQLSDGYRATIALAVDLMATFTKRWDSVDIARGLVLVDEIGAHLHPRWQMRVVKSFREAFPELQFIATTHDPLVLRGLEGPHEVAVLRRTDDHRMYALPSHKLPPVNEMRVDELLGSELFGLGSTIDPDIEDKFERYYQLLAVRDPDRDTIDEIEEIRNELAGHRQFGVTRRERLALEAADEYLAEEWNEPDPAEREKLLGESMAKLRAIWAGEKKL